MILFPRGKICVSATINIEIVLTVHDKTLYIRADHRVPDTTHGDNIGTQTKC